MILLFMAVEIASIVLLGWFLMVNFFISFMPFMDFKFMVHILFNYFVDSVAIFHFLKLSISSVNPNGAVSLVSEIYIWPFVAGGDEYAQSLISYNSKIKGTDKVIFKFEL